MHARPASPSEAREQFHTARAPWPGPCSSVARAQAKQAAQAAREREAEVPQREVALALRHLQRDVERAVLVEERRAGAGGPAAEDRAT